MLKSDNLWDEPKTGVEFVEDNRLINEQKHDETWWIVRIVTVRVLTRQASLDKRMIRAVKIFILQLIA